MNWLMKLERKFGKYAIQNLTKYLLTCYAVGYVVSITVPKLAYYLTFEPALIFEGQIWRVISWVIIPPTDGIIYFIFMMLLYYSLGMTLEHIWGAFRYNLYIFSGMLFTVVGAFAAYFLLSFQVGRPIVGIGALVSTYYINLTIFLACAAIMPELKLYLYGILPVKMKWFAILDAVLIGVDLVNGSTVTRIIIIASLLNFILFFLSSRSAQRMNPKQVVRRKKFQQEVKRPVQVFENGARHKCAVCGRTELDDPNLEFRYCSKCKGNHEYCSDHLFTHEHVK